MSQTLGGQSPGVFAVVSLVLLLGGWQLSRRRGHRLVHPAGTDAGDLPLSLAERQPEPAARG